MQLQQGILLKFAISVLFLAKYVLTESFPCVKHGICGCVFKNGTKNMRISLSDLNNKNKDVPYFKNLPGTQEKYNYDLNLCTGFNYPFNQVQVGQNLSTAKLQTDECKGVTGCQINLINGSAIAIAKPAIKKFGDYSPESKKRQQVTYEETAAKRQMILFLTCDEKVERQVDPIPDANNLYYVSITSKYVCPQEYNPPNSEPVSHVLSIGSILVIIFFVLLVGYFISGILFMKYKKGATGKELIPHINFWSLLPGLMKDGCVFSGGKMKQLCQKNNYEEI